MEPDSWLTTAEAAAYTRRDPTTIRRAAASGQLRTSQRTGRKGHHRHRREWLDAWERGEKPPALRSA